MMQPHGCGAARHTTALMHCMRACMPPTACCPPARPPACPRTHRRPCAPLLLDACAQSMAGSTVAQLAECDFYVALALVRMALQSGAAPGARMHGGALLPRALPSTLAGLLRGRRWRRASSRRSGMGAPACGLDTAPTRPGRYCAAGPRLTAADVPLGVLRNKWLDAAETMAQAKGATHRVVGCALRELGR